MSVAHVLITGASGAMGTILRRGLPRADRTFALLDRRPVHDPRPTDRLHLGSLSDPEVVAAACEGADAIIHLGGEPTEAPWDDIVASNLTGTRTLLEAAVGAGVGTVVLASSNHAVGLRTRGSDPIPADAAAAPDSLYGLSKAVVEMLGALYHQRHGLDVTCLRIGRCTRRPETERALINWLSPADAVRLVEACLQPRPIGHRILWGVSDNTRGWFDLEPGRRFGYDPRDDAERYADQVGGAPDAQWYDALVGGHFAARPLGHRARS